LPLIAYNFWDDPVDSGSDKFVSNGRAISGLNEILSRHLEGLRSSTKILHTGKQLSWSRFEPGIQLDQKPIVIDDNA
jgi:hypothetical protein